MSESCWLLRLLTYHRADSSVDGPQGTSVGLHTWRLVTCKFLVFSLPQFPSATQKSASLQVSLLSSKVSLVPRIFRAPISLLVHNEKTTSYNGSLQISSLCPPSSVSSPASICIPAIGEVYCFYYVFGCRLIPYLCSEPQPTVPPGNSLRQPSLLLNLQTLSLPISHQLLNIFNIFHPTTIIWPNASSSHYPLCLPISTNITS